jgi:Bacterial Ig domain
MTAPTDAPAARQTAPSEAAGQVTGSTLWHTVGVIGMAIPVVVYFWFLHHYALNVIFWDQWSDIYVIGHQAWSNLWGQHGDHRILFPNLVVITLADTTHLNIVVEEFISAGCLLVATALIVLAHRRRAPGTSWLFYVPVVAVMFSLNQVQNTLWGFQLAWYMVLLALAAAIYVIDRPALSWPSLGLAVLIAVVGSFSSLMGLFIWPAALLILLQRRRPRAFVWAWLGAALVTVVIYFHSFAFNQATSGNDNSYAFHHVLATFKYLVFGLGGSVGLPASPGWPAELFGTVLLVVSCGVLVASALRRDETSGRSIGGALIIVGLLFAGSTALGRTWSGLFLASRYNTFYFLLLVGSYLALFDRFTAAPSRSATTEVPVTSTSFPSSARPGRRAWQVAVLVVVAVLVCVEVVSGTRQGINEARSWSAQQQLVAAVSLNIDHVPDSTINSAGLYPGTPPWFLRSMAAEATAKHLSLFGTAPPPYVLALTHGSVRLVRPAPNAVLRGRVILVAAASDPIGISRVTFQLSGPQLPHPVIVGRGTTVEYAWVNEWNSTTVPDGTYELQALAASSLGNHFVSPVVSVRVAN